MNKFVVGLLLMVIIVDMFCPSEAWWLGRRRCNLKMKRRHGWKNDFDGHLKFKCSAGQALRQVQSTYRSCAKDRVFKFGCSYNWNTKRMTICNWSHHWINDWDQPFSFTCPHHGILAGIESYHHNSYEDRRYKFYCCHSYWHHAHFCKTSGYVNNWRTYINFRAPRNRFIVGAISFHRDSQEDRLWKFQYCKVY
ncbi:hemagglutinin/amebocyte aggregation factor isoform X2 [Exaiptasia diaphana]|uniref:Dermatopontin n=1 Tax=Exaiptasia diaphana TaxID=2652724 RepID=A0A913YF74_EXADI|nr:hemagglutinin/amebocyte aggregation factor isoform X2 [Exaiptasia diaphana]